MEHVNLSDGFIRVLTGAELADRLRTVASNVRAFDKVTRAGLLNEAARRLDALTETLPAPADRVSA